MSYLKNTKYLTNSGKYLKNAALTEFSYVHYYGVIEGGVRTATVNFALLTEAEYEPFDAVLPLEITFPETVGWQVFAEPVEVVTRTKWEAGINNSGEIGASTDLWPAPTLQQYNGAWYKVYVTNYQTIFFNPVTVS
jgi:hypothetical protein